MKTRAAMLLIFAILMAGCGPGKPEMPASPSSGRPETRGLEAAGAAGYDGAAVRQSVDRTLNRNDARNAEAAKAIDAAEEK